VCSPCSPGLECEWWAPRTPRCATRWVTLRPLSPASGQLLKRRWLRANAWAREKSGRLLQDTALPLSAVTRPPRLAVSTREGNLMRKTIAVPLVAVGIVALTATGVYAGARGYDRADGNAQVTAGSSTCLGKKPTIVGKGTTVMGT